MFFFKILIHLVDFTAPTALQAHSIGKGKTITSYPAMKKYFTEDYHYVEDLVVVDGNVELFYLEKPIINQSLAIYLYRKPDN